ncbi:DUF418 domain-containing protein [Flavisolibacter sp. BT320]|nr:DUF418 domain-containing protein [Flavisolibacter longurius]
MNQPLSVPVQPAQRIQVIDTLRGMALLGILLMNIPYFSTPEVAAENLNVWGEYSGPNFYTWWVVNGLFEGTMRATFSMLFGAGAILLLTKLENKSSDINPADIYYRRLLWLFLFGLINAFVLLWPGDILYTYAICGLFLFPFRKMKPKFLLLFSLAFLLFATMQGTYRMYQSHSTRVEGEKALLLEKNKQILSEKQKEAKEKWLGYQDRSRPENKQKEAIKETETVSSGSYFGLMAYFSGINAMLQSKALYHSRFFDAMSMFFLGMALFKWGVITGQRSRRFYLWMVLLCYGVGLPLSYWEHSTAVVVRFDSSLLFERFGVNFYQIRRTALALGHLSLVILLFKAGVLKMLWRWLAGVGQMAFTNYLMQSVFCGLVFYGVGFGLYGKLQRYETYYVVAAVWVVQIIFSNVWLRYYRFGPLEWVWRSLTYGEKQSFKKESPVPDAALASVISGKETRIIVPGKNEDSTITG